MYTHTERGLLERSREGNRCKMRERERESESGRAKEMTRGRCKALYNINVFHKDKLGGTPLTPLEGGNGIK